MKYTAITAAVAAMTIGLAIPVQVSAQSKSAQDAAQANPGQSSSTQGSSAQTASPALPVTALDVSSITGRITDIDPGKRTVTVRSEDGNMATMVVGANVENFDKIKLNDEVTMRYMEARTVAILEGGPAPKLGEIRTQVQADASRPTPAKGKPGMAVMERNFEVFNVFEIDRQNNILTLRGTSGVPIDIMVNDGDLLKNLELNDRIVMSYRQIAAVSIKPADSKKK